MPSYLQYKRQLAVLDVADDDIESWITVKGNHIPIRKGQSKEEAVSNFMERKRAETNRDKHQQEYNKLSEQHTKLKDEIAQAQKRFDEMWTNLEDYKNNPEMKELAFENNGRHLALTALSRKMDKEKAYIKKYQDTLNRLDNQENNLTDTGVAKMVNFGSMPQERVKEAITTLKGLQSKYPFMKGKLDYIGTQESKEFKEWYRNDIIEYGLQQQYVSIMDSIKEARTIVEKGLGDRTDIWSKQKYAWAEGVVKSVKELGEDGYARKWVETHYRTTRRFTDRLWAIYQSRTDRKGGVIVFNANNYDEHGDGKDVVSKFHPVGCDTPKSVLDHEFGHSIYYDLELDKVFRYSDDEPLGKLRNFIVHEFKSHNKEYIKNELSLYAATNLSEFFAEAFAEYQNNPEPRRIAKTVGDYLEQYMKEVADGTDEKRFQERLKKI